MNLSLHGKLDVKSNEINILTSENSSLKNDLSQSNEDNFRLKEQLKKFGDEISHCQDFEENIRIQLDHCMKNLDEK